MRYSQIGTVEKKQVYGEQELNFSYIELEVAQDI